MPGENIQSSRLPYAGLVEHAKKNYRYSTVAIWCTIPTRDVGSVIDIGAHRLRGTLAGFLEVRIRGHTPPGTFET